MLLRTLNYHLLADSSHKFITNSNFFPQLQASMISYLASPFKRPKAISNITCPKLTLMLPAPPPPKKICFSHNLPQINKWQILPMLIKLRILISFLTPYFHAHHQSISKNPECDLFVPPPCYCPDKGTLVSLCVTLGYLFGFPWWELNELLFVKWSTVSITHKCF